MTRVLVTGAGGYIGTVLTAMLVEAGYDVRGVDRFFFGMRLPAGHPNLEIVREDTRCLTPGHFRGVDAAIDLAALSNDASGDRFKDATWAINHRARVETARMAKAAGVARYILPSSCSNPEDYPEAARVGRQTVSLPRMTDGDVADMIEAVERALAEGAQTA